MKDNVGKGKLTEAELKILEKSVERDSKRISSFVYKMNKGPHPLKPYTD